MRYLTLLVFCTGLLSACSREHSAEAILQDYLQRVETATGIARQTTSPLTPVLYPAHRDLVLASEDNRIGLLEFLKLQGCELFHLLSERNSVLGKVMPPSRRLVYEVSFLQEAAACYQKLGEAPQPNPQLLEEVSKAIASKRANLPKIFWNATFASPDMQKAFSLAVTPLAPGEQTAYHNSRQAIEYFKAIGSRLQEAELSISIEELEGHSFSLQRQQYGGRLFNALAQLTDYLNRAAYSLERLTERPLCYQKKPIGKAAILQNILIHHYAGKVQPYLAQLHQQGQDWLSAIEELTRLQAIQAPEVFTAYQERMLSLKHPASLWQSFERAIHRHTNAWQSLLSQCGLMPGAGISASLSG